MGNVLHPHDLDIGLLFFCRFSAELCFFLMRHANVLAINSCKDFSISGDAKLVNHSICFSKGVSLTRNSLYMGRPFAPQCGAHYRPVEPQTFQLILCFYSGFSARTNKILSSQLYIECVPTSINPTSFSPLNSNNMRSFASAKQLIISALRACL